MRPPGSNLDIGNPPKMKLNENGRLKYKLIIRFYGTMQAMCITIYGKNSLHYDKNSC